MRSMISVVCLILMASTASPALAGDLDIQVIDGLVSIQADAVPLGRLLSLLDRVAGTESTVPADLASRNVSVQFQEMGLDGAIRKTFEGLALDYAVLDETRIVVTSASMVLGPGSAGSAPSSPVSSAATPRPVRAPSQDVPVNPFQMVVPNADAGRNGSTPQPPVVQTPFGPLVNPRSTQQPGSGLPGAGQGFPFGGAGTPVISTQPEGSQPRIFGNTAPPMLDLNKSQPTSRDPSRP